MRFVVHAALVASLLGLASVAVPFVGRFLAIGLGIFAIGASLVARAKLTGVSRWVGALALGLGALALLLGTLKLLATHLMLGRLAAIVGG